jgi:hypothetical protein
MNTQIKELIEQQLQKEVQRLINKETRVFTLEYVSVDKVIRHLKDLGFKDNDDFSSNGWQYDFWLSMSHAEYGKANIAGSGYYGSVTVELY